MGFWKERQIEQTEVGFYSDGRKEVCEDCVADPFLKTFVGENASDWTCDFCGNDGPTASTDAVLKEISLAVGRVWRTAESEGITPGSEDEVGQAALTEIDDVLHIEDALPLGNEPFEEFVLHSFAESRWVRPDPFVVSETETLDYSWANFSEVVMYENRYFFTPNIVGDRGPDLILYGVEILKRIGGLIDEYGLVSELRPAHDLHRIRVHAAEDEYATAPDLGTPPRESTSQNRMSPAGIEMLYVSSDRETALAETLSETDAGRTASAARFRLRQPIKVVDFSRLPEYPSLFDGAEESVARRPTIGFLHKFRQDLSRSIERDDRVHIEYVPTQVVCEYVRSVFRSDAGEIGGLAFDSARQPGGRNWALFINHEHCLDPGRQPFFKDRPVAELVDVERLEIDGELLDRLGVLPARPAG